MKTCPHRGLYVNFIAALFTAAENWKQPKCPSTGESHLSALLLRNKLQTNQTQQSAY